MKLISYDRLIEALPGPLSSSRPARAKHCSGRFEAHTLGSPWTEAQAQLRPGVAARVKRQIEGRIERGEHPERPAAAGRDAVTIAAAKDLGVNQSTVQRRPAVLEGRRRRMGP